jgi:hypothetical protein
MVVGIFVVVGGCSSSDTELVDGVTSSSTGGQNVTKHICNVTKAGSKGTTASACYSSCDDGKTYCVNCDGDTCACTIDGVTTSTVASSVLYADPKEVTDPAFRAKASTACSFDLL